MSDSKAEDLMASFIGGGLEECNTFGAVFPDAERGGFLCIYPWEETVAISVIADSGSSLVNINAKTARVLLKTLGLMIEEADRLEADRLSRQKRAE